MDNNLTPFISVKAEYLDADIAEKHAKDGVVNINISESAIRDLDINDESFSFRTRFAGVETIISVPIASVVALYAKENPNSTVFFAADSSSSDDAENNEHSPNHTPVPHFRKKPDLKIVE